MPTLAMMAKEEYEKPIKVENENNVSLETLFLRYLDQKIHEAKDMLIERFNWICSQSPASAKFMYENGVMAGYVPEEGIRSALKHGTLAMGQLGMAETLQILIGCDHTTPEGMELAKRIEALFNKRCAEFKQEYKLNFTCLGTPAEGLSGRFTRIDRAIYGKIKGVTDRDYYTNSFHVPVHYNISIAKKIKLEAPYHALTNAGHISYIELDGDVTENVEAFESVVRLMKEAGIGYGAINHPVDRDPVCGYVGVIKDVCPGCGRREGDPIPAELLKNLNYNK
jgi:ribonucleoside-triphosphate reductase